MCILYQRDQRVLLMWAEDLDAWIGIDNDMGVFEAYPGYDAPILVPRWHDRERSLVPARWGMVPPWAKSESFGRKNAVNARGETLLEKPTFRTAFRKRRCIVPASAFFERLDGR